MTISIEMLLHKSSNYTFYFPTRLNDQKVEIIFKGSSMDSELQLKGEHLNASKMFVKFLLILVFLLSLLRHCKSCVVSEEEVGYINREVIQLYLKVSQQAVWGRTELELIPSIFQTGA